MRIRVWGCRGSITTPGPTTLRYGGNSTCEEIGDGFKFIEIRTRPRLLNYLAFLY
jgi:hypothetical protein